MEFPSEELNMLSFPMVAGVLTNGLRVYERG